MSESLEQRALRIAREMRSFDSPSMTTAVLEFARRLTAEQQKQEPVTPMYLIDGNPVFPAGSVLYASPPQDAQDGMVMMPREPTYEMVQAGAKLVKDNLPYHTGTKAIYIAMLDAAMRGKGE